MGIEITINGVAYPCYPMMGAMLRFKRETGKEITEIDATSFTELCTYLWCCLVSASKYEGKDFNLSLIDFADSVSVEDMRAWTDAVMKMQEASSSAEADSTVEKKTLQ